MEAENANNGAVAAPKKQIKIKEVLQMLKDGKDRKQIGEELELRPYEVNALFKHPDLKGKKVKKEPVLSFEIIDESTEEERQTENVHEGGAPLS